MNLVNQVITIAAVVIGAATTYLVTALGDRARDRRAEARQWGDRKLQSYTSYANDVKNLAIVCRQLTARHGMHAAAPGIEPERAASLLDEAKVRRSASYESVKLLGDAATTRATRTLNDAVHLLEWLARGRFADASPADWDRSWLAYLDAADEFRRSVRRELDVPGEFLPHGEWAPPSLPRRGEEPAKAQGRPAAPAP
jgi:hypothetical protein